MKKLLIAGLLLLAAGAAAFAGGKQESKGLSGDYELGGSTTVEPVALATNDVFEEKYPGLNLSYDSQGSSVGVQGALEGTYILGGASREVKDSEKEKGAKSVAIAKDGVAVIVNKDSINISNLALEEIADIFAGDISNWKEVGGPDHDIVVFSRDEASGTRDCFDSGTVKAFDKKIVGSAAIVTSNGDMVSKVGSTPYAIGYCGFGYITRDPGTKTVTVNGVVPEPKNVLDGSYAVSRNLNIVYTGSLDDDPFKKAYVDFLLSDDGQAIVAEEDFIPLQ